MLQDSIIDPATCQSYLETQYHDHGDTPLTLQVGVANASLGARYKALRVESCACITACNPLSQSLEACVNADLHAAVADELRQRNGIGMGRGLFTGMRRHALTAEEGALSWM